MNTFWIVIITICAYSAVLSILEMLAEKSSYSEHPILLFIAIGPVGWILFLIIKICAAIKHAICKKFKIKERIKENKPYSEKRAKRIVDKVCRIYLKNLKKEIKINNGEYEKDIFTLEDFGNDDNGISNLKQLLIIKPTHELINKKYLRLYYYQKNLLIKFLKPHLSLVTKQDFESWDFDEYWIKMQEDAELYIVVR